jgi:hypothetical protein
MRRYVPSIVAAVVASLSGACDGGNPGDSAQRRDSGGAAASVAATDTSVRKTTNASPAMTDELVLTLAVDTTAPTRPLLRCVTNLPNAAELSGEIRSLDEESERYQARLVVKDGACVAGPFGGASGLPAGSYIAEVFLSAPIQPDEVKAVIGPSGERLRGPLVKRKVDWGATAEVSVRFRVGGPTGAQAGQERAGRTTREAKLLYSELVSLLARGRDMKRWRDPNDMAALRRCGIEMRKNMAQQERLRARADSLPIRFITLGEAATYLGGCVTCAPNAEREWCSLAAERLREARDVVR